MDELKRAQLLADELQQMFESDTFRFFWRYIENHRAVEEVSVLNTGKSEDTTVEQIALNLRYRQGRHDGIVGVLAMKKDLIEQLRAGRVPKVPKVVKDGS